ncbi:hypothetical protein Pmani_009909 [Petrolisthes manimaculis]|uniref:Small integral membrane protein 20 n=1 Tax=Petrolisthes manimaculis TaxID=1843537 RepID=A0AAE1Q3P6_9EUCA|nr:hypothetical protein Pmani_009909 [Petrolisthes manimaculis]
MSFHTLMFLSGSPAHSVSAPYYIQKVNVTHVNKNQLLPVGQTPIRMTVLKGWRYAAFLGGFVGFIGAAIYPIIIYPMMNPEVYRKAQAENRKGINQEDIQPGNMKVWTDPFGRKQQ